MSRMSRRLSNATPIALLCWVLATGPASLAATHTWTRLNPALPSPPRAAMTMAYDPVSGFVVTFGGYDDTFTYLNQTWIWDGVEWAQPIVQTPPPARAAAGMAFDRVTHQLVLFGGFNGSSYLGDTWTWDGSNNSWTHRSTATKPPAVTGPMLFPDPRTGHVDMVGGFDGMFFHSDTWTWTGTDWRKLQPATSPTARGSAIAELDKANGTVVMFSGIGDLNVYDTWTWDGSTWTRQSPAHQPPARFYSSSAYVPALKGVVIFGGGSGNGDLNDTWEWTGTDWIQLQVGTPPAKRESQGMTYDPLMRQIVMFGGQVQGTVADDTWAL
jgi:hypothetical protein